MDDASQVRVGLEVPGIAVGVVIASGCRVGDSSPELLREIEVAIATAVAGKESEARLQRKAVVRDMLRHGTYKPTGRAKPASEFLLNAALEGTFPYINNLVDINNLVSLETMLPISLIDVRKAGFRDFTCRWGRPGENYVFNPSGQVLELADLLLLSRLPADLPCGTPVKDSQETKTDGTTVDVLGIVWAPAAMRDDAAEAARRMADLIRRHAGAQADAGRLP